MIKINFIEKFDVIVCLDGILPTSDFFENFQNIPIIAADGAAIKLMEMNIQFDKVIGDLDTLKINGFQKKISPEKILYLPDQEFNDFEKTLNYAYEMGFIKILILGFHGGELEHSFNNWSVLIKYISKLSLCIYENGRYAIPLNNSISLLTKPEEMIGIIPQPTARLTTSGFKWELNNEILELGVREGARNIALANEVSIEIHSGSILLIIDSRLPHTANF